MTPRARGTQAKDEIGITSPNHEDGNKHLSGSGPDCKICGDLEAAAGTQGYYKGFCFIERG
ncbi:unnamed protein product [marine sediment metagenome]|uniref:Uncharacterized protein n=1 Tax=marine sediment metagenome TaxID=412755 RepID=X1BBN4_9ZZZZ